MNKPYTFRQFLLDEGKEPVLKAIALYKKYDRIKKRATLFIPAMENEQAEIFSKVNHLHFSYQIECFKRNVEPEKLGSIL